MLLNPSHYSPQGLMPQFAGLQAAGIPQIGPGFFGQPGFGQPGAYGGNGGANGLMQYPFGTQQPFGQQPFGAQQYPFAGQTNPYLQGAQSPFQQSPLTLNPYLQNQLPPGPHLAQHVVNILGQLAQQNFSQSALTQQIGAAIQQLAQIVQTVMSQQSLTAGQGFGQSPFASPNQGGYGALGTQAAFGPQSQAWSSNRPTTIQ